MGEEREEKAPPMKKQGPGDLRLSSRPLDGYREVARRLGMLCNAACNNPP